MKLKTLAALHNDEIYKNKMVSIGDKVDVNGVYGIVRYIGYTQFSDGIWYGVELDEPVGKNDGSVQGKKYFTLEKKGLYGIFAKLQSMTIIKSEDRISPQVEISRLLEENNRLRQQLQDVKTQGPNEIIEFLTMEASDLTKSMDALKDELAACKRREDTQTKLQAVYMEMEKELRDQLEELEMSYQKEFEIMTNEKERLVEQLAEKTSPQWEIKELQSKLKIMEQQLYENKLLKDLCEISSHSKENPKEAQFEFLSKKIVDDRISNSFVEKQKCRVVLIILSIMSRIFTDENMREGYVRDLADISQWTTLLLSRSIPKEKIQITPISHFLESRPELNTNVSLGLRCTVAVFGKIIPELLAFHMENAAHKPPLELITKLYSVCLLIKKKSQALLDRISGTCNLLVAQGGFSLICLFSIIFKDILGPFESEFQNADILKSATSILRQVESITVKEKIDNHENIDGREASKAASVVSNTSMISTDDITVQLRGKETEVKELLIKNQVYRQKLEELNNHDAEYDTMKIEIRDLRQYSDCLEQKIIDLRTLVEELQQKLNHEQLRAYPYGSNDEYGDLAVELINSEKLDLIAEIMDLRKIVSKHVVKEYEDLLDLKWLEERIPRESSNIIDLRLSNGIHFLGNEILDLVNYSQTIDLECNGLKKNYMANARFKMSTINSAINDVKAT